MPAPERVCSTCRFYKPYGGSKLLEETFAKCVSPQKPNHIQFADTCKGDFKLCGSNGRWWEPKPAPFEIVEDEPGTLDWEEPEED